MNETVTYRLGSKVQCSDTDTDCGELLQLVVEPAASRPGPADPGPQDRTRVTDLVVRSSTQGSHLIPLSLAQPAGAAIVLDCEREDLASFPAQMVRPRSVALGRGDRVRAVDGYAGHVEGMAIRSDTGEIVQVLVAAGPRWHRRHVAVPAAAVPGFSPEGVRVLLSKKQVKDLGSAALRQGAHSRASAS